jgi:hypothetical protein
VNSLVQTAAGYIQNILKRSLKRAQTERVLVVFDRQSGLSSIMADAYQAAIPDGTFLDFDVAGEAGVRSALDELKEGDLVILVQSTSFRLNEFRIRIELFNRKLKTIEHVHLNRMPEEQWATWIETLSFNPEEGGETGRKLKAILDQAQTITMECGDLKLTWNGGLEAAKMNIGDYTGMDNIGGTFPIGEVFTEAKVLENTNGALKIYAFADQDFLVKFYEPFTAFVKDGLIEAGPDAPPEFVSVLEKIRLDERAIVREFGLGLNAAISQHKPLADITAFERVLGPHLSLGEKHGVYKKPGIPTKSRYHVDVFPAADRILADSKVIYDGQRFLP